MVDEDNKFQLSPRNPQNLNVKEAFNPQSAAQSQPTFYVCGFNFNPDKSEEK
jgi:hypothetical protein